MAKEKDLKMIYPNVQISTPKQCKMARAKAIAYNSILLLETQQELCCNAWPDFFDRARKYYAGKITEDLYYNDLPKLDAHLEGLDDLLSIIESKSYTIPHYEYESIHFWGSLDVLLDIDEGIVPQRLIQKVKEMMKIMDEDEESCSWYGGEETPELGMEDEDQDYNNGFSIHHFYDRATIKSMINAHDYDDDEDD